MKQRRLVTIKLWTSAGMTRITETVGVLGTIKQITTNDPATVARGHGGSKEGAAAARSTMQQRIREAEVAARCFLYDNQDATAADLGKYLTEAGYTNRYRRPWDGRLLQKYYDRAFEQIARPSDITTTNPEG